MAKKQIDVEKFLKWLEEQRGRQIVGKKIAARHGDYALAAELQKGEEVYDEVISCVKYPTVFGVDWAIEDKGEENNERV